MGEYQEDDADFNDLLESDSDEEEDGKNQKQTADNLLSLDDVVISEGTGGSDYKSKTLDFMFLPENLDDDDDEDEKMEEQESKNDEEFKQELEKRRTFQRLLHSVPPGIDLFR